VSDLAAALRAEGLADVDDSSLARAMYSTDASLYRVVPAVVVHPRHADEIAAALRAAGVPVEVSDNVAGALWAKLVVNCAYNALSAITQLPYGRLVQGEQVGAVMRDVVEECLAVARASGVKVPGDMHATVKKIGETMPAQFSSTAQDLARGKPTEIDHLNGLVVRKGEALGVPTPANRLLFSLVRLLESKSRRA